jgi:hypothetical protein
MGRGSAAQRAAKIKEQLQVASEEQAKIAEQAIAAVENGVDPKIAADLAVAAANELEVLKEITPVMEELLREEARGPVKNANTGATKKIKVKGEWEGSGYSVVLNFNNSKYQMDIQDDGTAVVSVEVANALVSPDSDYEFCE